MDHQLNDRRTDDGMNGQQEVERLNFLRDYFESGCLCIQKGSLMKLDSSVPNLEAVANYEKHCQCSRNY